MGGEGKRALKSCRLPAVVGEDEQRIRCKYYSVGCLTVAPNKEEYLAHLKSDKKRHLLLLEQVVLDQSDIISEQLEELASQGQALAKLQSSMEGSCCLWQSFVSSAFDGIAGLWAAVRDLDTNKIRLQLEQFSEPKQPDGSPWRLKPWQLLYLVVFAFIFACYSLFLGQGGIRGLSIQQVLPLFIYTTFSVFHLWNAKYLSPIANCVAATYLTTVWMVLNVVLLPVF